MLIKSDADGVRLCNSVKLSLILFFTFWRSKSFFFFLNFSTRDCFIQLNCRKSISRKLPSQKSCSFYYFILERKIKLKFVWKFVLTVPHPSHSQPLWNIRLIFHLQMAWANKVKVYLHSYKCFQLVQYNSFTVWVLD